jgi:hypothetical protein
VPGPGRDRAHVTGGRSSSVLEESTYEARYRTCPVVCVAGCASTGGSESNRAAAFSSNPTHCRLGPDRREWPIRAGPAAEVASGADGDYQIVKDYIPSPPSNPRIAIKLDDRIRLVAVGSDRLRLIHLQNRPGLGYRELAVATLVSDSSGLWFRGAARLAGSSEPVGEYIVFRHRDLPAPKSRSHSESAGVQGIPSGVLRRSG